MGWGIMPERVTQQTKQVCRICGKPVEAGQKFYFRNKTEDVVHEKCWNKTVDEECWDKMIDEEFIVKHREGMK